MNWSFWIVVGAGVVAFLILKRVALIRPAKAREALDAGAIVIDVRSEAEFQKEHLPSALNIPLNRLGEEIYRQVPDKDRAVLLHCLSGGRSGIGKGILNRLGYRNVFNLGSYGRAAKIIAARL